MSQKSISGGSFLGDEIKNRRKELELTIEEAAKKAGVGTKTWCRYESGESIRHDKCFGVCKALNWKSLPVDNDEPILNLAKHKSREDWPKSIAELYGDDAAMSFVIGSDILDDEITEDMVTLAEMPRGSHLGQLRFSMVGDMLPEQFLTRYDYEFLYALRCTLRGIIKSTSYMDNFRARTVLEEILLYMILEESRNLMEESYKATNPHWDEWAYDCLGDMDVVTFLYSDLYLEEENIYHFNQWMMPQFYLSE